MAPNEKALSIPVDLLSNITQNKLINTLRPFINNETVSNTQLHFIIAFYRVTKTTETQLWNLHFMRHENLIKNFKKPVRGRSSLASSKAPHGGRRLQHQTPWPDRREPQVGRGLPGSPFPPLSTFIKSFPGARSHTHDGMVSP